MVYPISMSAVWYKPRKQDSDGDGVDKDELMFDEMTRQFNGVDSDNDGQIDAKESEEKDKDGDGVQMPETHAMTI